jgi:hypothetical protein
VTYPNSYFFRFLWTFHMHHNYWSSCQKRLDLGEISVKILLKGGKLVITRPPLVIVFFHIWKEPFFLMFAQSCGSGMFIPNPNFFHHGSEFFPSRIWIFSSRIRIKEFKFFNQKMVSKLLEIWFRLFIPDPGVKRHRIPNSYPQHCVHLLSYLFLC